MGFETNDDAATGLPLVALGADSTRKVDAYMKAHGFREGEYQVTAFDAPTKASAVIADEQRMVDLFRECALAVAAMRAGVQLLDNVTLKTEISERFKTAIRLESSATALESAISRANGGAA